MGKIWKLTLLAAFLLAGAGLGSVVRAQVDEEEGIEDEELGEPEPLLLGTVTANKNAIRLTTLTEANTSLTSSTSFVTLASTTVNVPANRTGVILATFSGEAFCADVLYCTMRVLVDGVETFPQSGNNFAFTSPGDLFWESKAFDRVSGELAPGNHTVALQWAIVGPGPGNPQFILDDWQLTLALWRVS